MRGIQQNALSTQRLASMVARQIALNSAERSLWIAFYIETKEDCCILFLAYNLLIKEEKSVQLPEANRICSDFLH
ncbi:hypothetical protein L9Z41_10065 [Leptospira noguchii]|uniref:hypothetical protein n=1 Tax=Leptospira noguchii TaxID=28182 RepID=UPI001F059218|nr:hypothetical protein [Leptospira noguchii]MCH1912288.1 hypothetical protein [Leptospira noguchii]MCH1915972.1 hypothetical protein [Leptospira noguchii]